MSLERLLILSVVLALGTVAYLKMRDHAPAMDRMAEAVAKWVPTDAADAEATIEDLEYALPDLPLPSQWVMLSAMPGFPMTSNPSSGNESANNSVSIRDLLFR